MKYLGTLKGVSLVSKLDNNDQPVHILSIKVELSEGHREVQQAVDHLKEMIQIDLTPRQPKL